MAEPRTKLIEVALPTGSYQSCRGAREVTAPRSSLDPAPVVVPQAACHLSGGAASVAARRSIGAAGRLPDASGSGARAEPLRSCRRPGGTRPGDERPRPPRRARDRPGDRGRSAAPAGPLLRRRRRGVGGRTAGTARHSQRPESRGRPDHAGPARPACPLCRPSTGAQTRRRAKLGRRGRAGRRRPLLWPLDARRGNPSDRRSLSGRTPARQTSAEPPRRSPGSGRGPCAVPIRPVTWSSRSCASGGWRCTGTRVPGWSRSSTGRPGTIHFEVRSGAGEPPPATVDRQGATCLVCHAVLSFAHVRAEARARRLGQRLLAVVAAGKRGRRYEPHGRAGGRRGPRPAALGAAPAAAAEPAKLQHADLRAGYLRQAVHAAPAHGAGHVRRPGRRRPGARPRRRACRAVEPPRAVLTRRGERWRRGIRRRGGDLPGLRRRPLCRRLVESGRLGGTRSKRPAAHSPARPCR